MEQIEVVTLSRAYVNGLNDEIKRLKQRVQELEAQFSREEFRKVGQISRQEAGKK